MYKHLNEDEKTIKHMVKRDEPLQAKTDIERDALNNATEVNVYRSLLATM